MKNTNIPAMAGINSNGQMTFNGQTKTTRVREKNHYTVNNIGKRIWDPLTQNHVDFQMFYEYARKGIFLNELKKNNLIDDVVDSAKYKFNGQESELAWLRKHNRQDVIDAILEDAALNTNLLDAPLVVPAESQQTNRQISEVCVKQAVEIDAKNEKINELHNTLGSINGKMQEMRDNVLTCKNAINEVLYSFNTELGDDNPEPIQDLPF